MPKKQQPKVALANFSRLAYRSVIALVSGLAAVAMISCNYKTSVSGSAPPTVAANGAQPTFAKLSADVLQSKCFGCHDGGQAPDLRSYKSFSAAATDTQLRIHDNDPKNHMPKSPAPQLSADELAELDGWIRAGSPEQGSKAGAPATPTPVPPAATPAPPPTAVGSQAQFAELSANVLTSKCFSCHDGGKAQDLRSLSSFTAASGSIKSRIHDPNPKVHMPRAPAPELTADELNQLDTWLNAGPTPTPTPPPSPTPVIPVCSFKWLVNNIIGKKCFSCHDGSTEQVDLSSYALFSAKASAIRNHVTLPWGTKGHMPPFSLARPHPQLTEAELTVLVTWIDEKAPENGIGEDGIIPDPTPTPVPTPTASPTPTPNPTPGI